MRSKLFFAVLVLCAALLFVALQSSPVSPPVPEELETTEPESALEPILPLSQREQDWIDDINFLSEKYKAIHLAPFCLCPEEEFDWKLERLKRNIGELSDEEIYFELKAIIAGMGDNHTTLYPSEALSDRIYSITWPIQIQCFDNHLYLCGYLKGYEQFGPYLLQEIVAVNGIDITYLERKVLSIARPFNEWSGKEWLGSYLVNPAFLDWAGCDYIEGYSIQILNKSHEVQSVEVPVITAGEASEGVWTYPENWDNLYCSVRGNLAEYIEGENGDCIYMNYVALDSVTAILSLFDSAAVLIEEYPECGKLVIDLRSHPGGNANRLPQIRTCTEKLSEFQIEQTYVITGGFTASGAIECAAIFQDVLDAVVIGEPTGQFSSFFIRVRQQANMLFLIRSSGAGFPTVGMKQESLLTHITMRMAGSTPGRTPSYLTYISIRTSRTSARGRTA